MRFYVFYKLQTQLDRESRLFFEKEQMNLSFFIGFYRKYVLSETNGSTSSVPYRNRDSITGCVIPPVPYQTGLQRQLTQDLSCQKTGSERPT